MKLAQALLGSSAAIVLVLGTVHLAYTFFGPRLRPREAALEAHMQAVSPVLTTQTTMWKAWLGFNASHSLGAIGFGLVYGYLAMALPAVLLHSPFLLATGLGWLCAYAIVGREYWFSVPNTGVKLSLLAYLAAITATLWAGAST